ncbi:family 20 glycosylhydrolase [Parapedobacter sp. SGR-10]|nr:family 20 glycosylhydrolase [Parapedobacter sp. SGR-10]
MLMRISNLFITLFVGLLNLTFSVSAQVSLLPAPQSIQYGKGKVYLSNDIRFVQELVEEDVFVKNNLESLLQEKLVDSPAKGGTIARIVLKRTGEPNPLPTVDEVVGRSSREYYAMTIKGDQIEITSPSSAGLFYGVQTLRQMITQDDKGVFVPELTLEDWPVMAYRGFMMDMTHMQFPTMDEIKKQIDFLSLWKINQYYFYSEANIELEGYPLLMPAARFTKEQVKEVIEYARERFIDVIPNLNLYGHLHDVFKHEHYTDLAATPYGQEFKVDHPDVEGIVLNWIDQFTGMFSSPFFHIGFDETYLMKYEAERMGMTPDELFLKMLNRTVKAVEEKGKKAMFYSDRLRLFPDGISKIEGSPIVVSWKYSTPPTGYGDYVAPFTERDLPVFVQSGSLNYWWLLPDVVSSFENSYVWLEAAQKFGSKGFIMSGWTDSWNALMRLTRPDMAHGAAVSWQKERMDNEEFFTAYCNAQYPDSIALLLTTSHQCLAEAAHISRDVFGKTSEQIWANPFSEEALKIYSEKKNELRRSKLLTEKAQILLMEAMKSGLDTTSMYAMLVGSKLLDYLLTKQLYAGRIADIYNTHKDSRDKRKFGAYMAEAHHFFSSFAVDMHNMVVENKVMFEKAWKNEFTDFRLGIALGHFDKELHNWFAVQRKLQRLNRLYDADEPFPPIQEYLKIDWD